MTELYLKRFLRKNLILVTGLLSASPAMADGYITKAPASGFDWNSGTDYVVLYAPQSQIEAMGSKIKSNQNLDPEQKDNQFFIGLPTGIKKI